MDRASTIDEPLGGVKVGRLTRLASLAWLQARRPFLERRIRRPVLEHIDGLPFVVLPEVLNPVVFRSGAFLARTVAALPPAAGGNGARPLAAPAAVGALAALTALDMGTGSGVGAVFAARRGYQVVGVDLNPDAVRCARANVLLNGQSVPAIYAGAAPGLVAGVIQVNFQIPSGFSGATLVNLQLQVGSAISPSGATLSVKGP